MDAKDWLTIGISIAAFLISVLAWRTAQAGLRLAQGQDARAVERERPLISLDMPSFIGRGPFDVGYKITNRAPAPICIIGLRLPITMGRTAVTWRAPFRFADIEGAGRVLQKPIGEEAGDYELKELNIDLAPGEMIASQFQIMPEPRDRVRSDTELQLYVDVVVRDREGTAYSLPITRSV